MFIRVDKKYLEEYKKNDYLLDIILKSQESVSDEIKNASLHQFNNMITHQWKRAMFHAMYSDIIGKKILDVGGGYCGCDGLFELNDYILLDPDEAFRGLDTSVITSTWEQITPEKYDIVVACDVFQTNSYDIEGFLKKYLPITKELRFSFTFRNVAKDRITLKKFNEILKQYGVEEEVYYEDIGLPGKRNVYLISLKGDL